MDTPCNYQQCTCNLDTLACESVLLRLDLTNRISYESILRIASGNITRFQLLNDLLRTQDNFKSDLYGYYKIPTWPLPGAWPLAIDKSYIATTDIDRQKRASQIVNLFFTNIPSLRILDFGCGEGSVCRELITRSAEFVMGYDIKTFPEWNNANNCLFTTEWQQVVSSAPYDAILIYDVIDHLQNDMPTDVLNKLTSVLKDSGKIYVRCHPWTAKHAAHLYNKENKAFVHLVVSDDILKSHDLTPEPLIKPTNPVPEYRKWFSSNGLRIIKEDILSEGLDSYFEHNDYAWNLLCSHWESVSGIHRLFYRYHPFNCGSTLTCRDAWIERLATGPIGLYPANAFGLYDMHGNVWEWCLDRHMDYDISHTILVDPLVTGDGGRVIRGGGCWDKDFNCRSAARPFFPEPSYNNADLGFRVVMEHGQHEDNTYVNSIGMKLALIPAGEFMMGSPPDEIYHNANEAQHKVRISRPFYMGVYPVTQEQFRDITGHNPSETISPDAADPCRANVDGHYRPNYPVVKVTWHQANDFCLKLGHKDHNTYRLPTEAEWEYSCRGISTDFTCTGDILSVEFVDYVLEKNQ